MSEELPKYVYADTKLDDIEKYVKLGYRVHTIDFNYGTALMSLSSAKYQNITHLADVDPDDVDKYLADGWIVAESWSKKVRMVLPGEV